MHIKRKPQAQHTDEASSLPAAEARDLILRGRAPAGLTVRGHLDLSSAESPPSLPDGLRANSINLSACQGLRSLPSGLRVRFELDLSNCTQLEALPEGLIAGSLILSGCTRLRALPVGLTAHFLDISGCTALREWPRQANIRLGRLTMRGCMQFTHFPPWLTNLAQLNICDCVGIRELPEHLRVSAWIDLANTQVQSLPDSMKGVQLMWRGIAIDERIAFHPETITIEEILGQENIELRRVLLERMGYEAFVAQAKAEVLDRDMDAGGPRRLLRIPLPDEEPLVCVSVICPSTGRQYVIRVPPHMRTCRQAIAWTAGFDDPDAYRPLIET